MARTTTVRHEALWKPYVNVGSTIVGRHCVGVEMLERRIAVVEQPLLCPAAEIPGGAGHNLTVAHSIGIDRIAVILDVAGTLRIVKSDIL